MAVAVHGVVVAAAAGGGGFAATAPNAWVRSWCWRWRCCFGKASHKHTPRGAFLMLWGILFSGGAVARFQVEKKRTNISGFSRPRERWGGRAGGRTGGRTGGRAGGRLGGPGFGPGLPGYGRARCIASPTPALFGQQRHTAFAGLLSRPKSLGAAAPRDAVTLAVLLGGDITSQPRCSPELVLLNQTERAVLTDWLDAEHSADADADAETDLRRTLSTDMLSCLVGAAAVERLAMAFGGSHNLVKLRRVTAAAAMSHGDFVDFHSDSHSRRTMQVALNAEADYRGGRLVFATGTGFVIPARPAGTATIHTDRLVHGVTALTSGVRYSLFLCDATDSQPAVDLRYLAAAVREQFGFFDKAVPFLEASSDAELGAVVTEYHARMLQGSGRLSSAGSSDIGVELVSRVHRLHPLAYLQATAACTRAAAAKPTMVGSREWAGVDLVRAVRRQAGFMQQVLAARPLLDHADVIADSMRQYRRFLELARGNAQPLAPTVPIDLVWHTHQQHSARYGPECVAIAGHFLDHDDDVAGAELEQATEATGAAWNASYGESLLG